MKIIRLVTCSIVLLTGMIWLSAGAEDQGAKCRMAVGKMIKQAEDPSNEELSRLRQECPEDISFRDVNRYRDNIKEQRRKIGEARDIVNTGVSELAK